MKRLVAILALSIAAVGLAASASAAPAPAATVAKLLHYDFAGQWGKAWDLLHPGQQRLVPRDRFIRCQVAAAPLAGYTLVSAREVSASGETLHIAGVPQHSAVAVTFHLTVRTGMGNMNAFDQVTHAVWTGTRWAWFLGAADVAAYRAGRCPS